ncbi:uncharacterized protein LOC123917336 isoform X2 [Trifolium pratense]|uniref:uncharacterized protein LOC123917336 isoform X2 n=1 Tax=Trifolium pratense TaxID=57577 RepID=UPI001E695807|nr:uncharacterized protein LOC123917336 isoform X2 [Trifolium pratense]
MWSDFMLELECMKLGWERDEYNNTDLSAMNMFKRVSNGEIVSDDEEEKEGEPSHVEGIDLYFADLLLCFECPFGSEINSNKCSNEHTLTASAYFKNASIDHATYRLLYHLFSEEEAILFKNGMQSLNLSSFIGSIGCKRNLFVWYY